MLKRELLKRNLRLEILLWLCFFKVVLIRTMIEVEARMVIRGVVAEVSINLVLILVLIMAKHLGIPILDSILVNLLGLPMLLLNFLVCNHIQFKNGGNSSGSHQVQGQSQNSRPTCQIYGKNGHTALDCYHRMNFAYQGRHAPAKLASMAASSMAASATANSALASNSAWLTDTGCLDHVTLDLSFLTFLSDFRE